MLPNVLDIYHHYENVFVVQQRLDQYFSRIDKIIRQKCTSARVRFLLQDVVELRKVCTLNNAITLAKLFAKETKQMYIINQSLIT